jgi:hypothetical protein
MSVMTTDAQSPKWRNALTWTAASFAALLFYTFGMSALIQEGPVGTLSDAGPVIAIIGGTVLATSALVGFSFRNRSFTGPNFARFLALTGLTLAMFLLIRWALPDRVSLETLGPSVAVPLVFGAALVTIAITGLLFTAAAHARLGIVPPEQGELLREQGRVLPYSLVVVAAMGLTLALLSLAGPGGLLSPRAALAGVAVLVGIQAALSFAIWPRIDELSQTLSRETGNAAYYLIVTFGGGWAILAHLGFVTAPAPLDWLTMLTVIMFAASVIAVGRRGLLQPPEA